MIELPDEFFVTWPGSRDSRPARALVVGVLIVRAAFSDEQTQYLGQLRHTLNRWVVDFAPIPGVRFTDVAELANALLIADEVSRFAPGDLEAARTEQEIVEAVGHELGNWIRYVTAREAAGVPPLHYRAWAEIALGIDARPRACAELVELEVAV